MECRTDKHYPFGHTNLFLRNYLKSHKVMAASLPPSILQQNDSNRWAYCLKYLVCLTINILLPTSHIIENDSQLF
ncbi:hypothetical protein [Absidia glauca]|uniref:Uncharacterized protein n=1 Tax=Absidia glauca TaxID=4829 RepID=A0A163K5F3_ABSGL|nr:hypothetical protein [Absidia glauca]